MCSNSQSSQHLPPWARGTAFLLFAVCFVIGLCTPIFSTQYALFGETGIRDVTLFRALSQLWMSGAWLYMLLVAGFLLIAPLVKQSLDVCNLRHVSFLADLVASFDLTSIFAAAVLIVAQSTQYVEARWGTAAILASSVLPWTFKHFVHGYKSQNRISANSTLAPLLRILLIVVSIALLVTGLLLPFFQVRPFDVFPVSKSILGGIETLWYEGSRPAAVLIALFSVVFPSLKLLALLLGALNVRLPSRLCSALVAAGPWSMLDVLAVFILLIYYLNLLLDSAVIGPALWIFFSYVVLSTYLCHEMYSKPAITPPRQSIWQMLAAAVAAASLLLVVYVGYSSVQRGMTQLSTDDLIKDLKRAHENEEDAPVTAFDEAQKFRIIRTLVQRVRKSDQLNKTQMSESPPTNGGAASERTKIMEALLNAMSPDSNLTDLERDLCIEMLILRRPIPRMEDESNPDEAMTEDAPASAQEFLTVAEQGLALKNLENRELSVLQKCKERSKVIEAYTNLSLTREAIRKIGVQASAPTP